MNRVIRGIIVSSLAVVGVLAAVPSVAHADERGPARVEARDHEHGRIERGERERAERDRRAHAERERQQHSVCGRAYESGASARRLQEMGCYVR